MFGAAKLTKNANFDKNKYSGYGIGFDTHGTLSLTYGREFSKSEIIFGADMSSSAYVDNRKKGFLFLCKGPTQKLDDTTLNAEKEYAINFSKQNFA